MMRFDLALYFVSGMLLILLVSLTPWLWRGGKAATETTKSTQRKRESKPFAGLTRKPECELYEQKVESYPQAPGLPPPRLIFARGRRRHIDTTSHFCHHATCSYHDWIGWGNIRANGHLGSRRWRSLVCLGCRGYLLKMKGIPLHDRQVDPDRLVGAITALTEGLSICAVPRVFEMVPNTVLIWLAETAAHLEAFSRYYLCDVKVEQRSVSRPMGLARLGSGNPGLLRWRPGGLTDRLWSLRDVLM